MSKSFIVAGTDTNVGKTILSSVLMAAHDDLQYWKPIQSGLEEKTDTETVRDLSECSAVRIFPEAYKLHRPLSPHLSARLDGVSIDIEQLQKPNAEHLIIETAGGVLTPINESTLQIDLIKMWSLPVLIVARSLLGTINHTLLTIEALRQRNIEIAGVIMIGESNPENEKAIGYYGKIKMLGRIPPLEDLNRETLRNTYKDHFFSLENIFAN